MTTETAPPTVTTEPAPAAHVARPPRYAIVEVMGHRRFGARIVKTRYCGVKMLRCEILCEPPITQYVKPEMLFALTPCTEAQAREVNTRWKLAEAVPFALPAGTRAAGDTTVDAETDDVPADGSGQDDDDRGDDDSLF